MQWLPFILETVNNTCHNQNILTSFQIIWKIVQFNSSNGQNGRMYDFRHLSLLSNTITKKLGSWLGITPYYVWDYYGNFRVGVYCFVNSYYIFMYSCFLGLLHRFQVFDVEKNDWWFVKNCPLMVYSNLLLAKIITSNEMQY